MKVHGSQGEVPRRLGKTPPWESQHLALLELTPELQEQVKASELKVEPARRIGRLPKGQPAGEAQKAIAAAKTPRQSITVQRPSPRSPAVPNSPLLRLEGGRSCASERSIPGQ